MKLRRIINIREILKHLVVLIVYIFVTTYFDFNARKLKTIDIPLLTKLLESLKYDTLTELVNFREFEAYSLAKGIQENLSVAAFAHPVLYHTSMENALSTLYTENYTFLISLDRLPDEAIKLFKSLGGEHFSCLMSDFTAPTYKQI